MQKTITYSDVARVGIAGFVFALGYIFFEALFLGPVHAQPVSLGLWVRRFLLVEGVGSFCALAAALAVVRRQFRIIAGMVYLCGACTLYTAAVIAARAHTAMTAISGIVGVSFIGMGTCCALVLWQTVHARYPDTASDVLVPDGKEPRMPMVLVWLALVSVPIAYMSLGISAFITLGVSVWICGVFMLLPHVPVFFLITLVIAPCASFIAGLRACKAVFFQRPLFQHAICLPYARIPRVADCVRAVCTSLDVRMPDTVILHAQPVFFVTEEKIETFDGSITGRTLAIGFPLVRSLPMQEVQAIIAHECAHFSGGDTWYSRFVSPVFTSLKNAFDELKGVSGNVSSVLLRRTLHVLLVVPRVFLRMCAAYFEALDAILGRMRELRADWRAVQYIGSEAVIASLKKSIAIGAHFHTVTESMGCAYQNYFDEYQRRLFADGVLSPEYIEKNIAAYQIDTRVPLRTRLLYIAHAAHSQSAAEQCASQSIGTELVSFGARLSALYQESIEGYRKQRSQVHALGHQLRALTRAHAQVVQDIFAVCAASLQLTHEQGECMVTHLVLGDAISFQAHKAVCAVIEAVKKDPVLFELLTAGALLRVACMNNNGAASDSLRLRAVYQRLGIADTAVCGAALPSFQQYIHSVETTHRRIVAEREGRGNMV